MTSSPRSRAPSGLAGRCWAAWHPCVVKAALHALETWVSTGTAPAAVARIETTTGDDPHVVRDGDGIAKGGIRTPPVDVPVNTLSGTPGPNPSVICTLFGSTTPLPTGRIAQFYPSRDQYMTKYTAAVDRAVKAGFVLQADRDAMLAYAQPDRVTA
ncbi:hypothetical protein BCD49_35765 [Pseudofrankia sp. EUN1h]|nr:MULTISPECIES: alpha/beta hydrolase domain-containing protein [Pseudofrankia]OHV29811.1 hypothetical protein BCD49_35765 [Pseudofrankia sp. EUN1h]